MCSYSQSIAKNNLANHFMEIMEDTFDLKVACRSAAIAYLNVGSSSSKRETKPPINKRKGKASSPLTQHLHWILKILVLLLKITFLLGFSIYILVATETTIPHEPTHDFLFEFVRGLYLPSMQAARFVSLALSIHKLPQFHDAHTKTCLLLNPYFELVQKAPKCQFCKDVQKVKDLTGLTSFTFQNNYHHSGTPFIIKDAFPTPIKLAELGELLFENFKFENFPSDDNSHLEFDVHQTNLSRPLRKFFPLPNFIPASSEVDYQQYMYIDGSSSSAYSLPMTTYGNVFIHQAQGRRLIKLTPVWRCKSTCSPFSVVLETGQVLYFSLYFWKAASLPVLDGMEDNFSILSMGNFYL